MIDKRFDILEEKGSNIYTNQLDYIKEADFIITATNAQYSIINESSLLKYGCIIIDDAQPINVSKKVIEERKDIIVVEGGVCNHPSIYYNLNLNLIEKGDMFSCLGEVMLIAATNRVDLAILGPTNPDMVCKVGKIATELGFKLAKLRSFGNLLDLDI